LQRKQRNKLRHAGAVITR